MNMESSFIFKNIQKDFYIKVIKGRIKFIYFVHYKFRKDDFMNKVPNMISTKDLAYLKDMFEWNFNASKLAHHMSLEITNPTVKDIVINVRNMHTEHCRKIKNLLMEGLNEQ